MPSTPPETRAGSSSLPRFLADPRVDRTIAAIAVLPSMYVIYWRLQHGTLDIIRVNLILQGLLFVVTMVARRPPVRVTLNPWFWLLAFVASYWVPFAALAAPAGTPIAPRAVALTLSWLGLLIIVYARLSLGRNIGLVPAQRKIVTTGAYGLVRHPIYTAVFVNYLALELQAYSPLTTALTGLGIFWFLVKSLVEEYFLKADPEYAAYMERVRHRWIPGVI